jgi:hypothetical protein
VAGNGPYRQRSSDIRLVNVYGPAARYTLLDRPKKVQTHYKVFPFEIIDEKTRSPLAEIRTQRSPSA